MSKPFTNNMSDINNARSSTTDTFSQSKTRVLEKVALIIEHNAYRLDEQMILELPRLLPPDKTQLSLVHVLSDVAVGLPFRHNHMQDLIQSLEERHQRQEAVQKEFRRCLEQQGFSIIDERAYALNGQTLPELTDYIAQSGQNLAIFYADQYPVAHMGRTPFFMQCIAHLPVSGIVLKRHLATARPALKVLLAVDDSEASMTAVRKLPELLRTERLEITLATVQSPVYQDNAVLAPFVNQDILDEALISNANMIFDMAQNILEAQGMSVSQAKRVIGSPAAELGYLAQVEEPDLLVVGSHNRKGFLAWLMGSVSSQLLHWDTHNILVVRE
jgi:nucleotide-binding universal stress UspA family protein